MANEYPKSTSYQGQYGRPIPARDWTHEPGDTLSVEGAEAVATSNTSAMMDTLCSLTAEDFSAAEVEKIRAVATLAMDDIRQYGHVML